MFDMNVGGVRRGEMNIRAQTAEIAASAGGRGESFDALYRQTHGEVVAYIATGGGSANAGVQVSESQRARIAGLYGQQAKPAGSVASQPVTTDSTTRDSFLQQIMPYANQASRHLGVSPDLLAAHAALETGWGKSVIQADDGSSSFNLFNVKADGSWRGAAVDAATTEFEHGVSVDKVEQFRKYPNYGAAFADYVRLLTGNPRYQAVLNAGENAQSFAKGLSAGGFATDPAYEGKLVAVANTIRKR